MGKSIAKKNFAVAPKKGVEQAKPGNFVLTKENYILIAIGFGVMVLGYILMAGGRTDDPNVFNDAMFSFRRITLAPILIVGGFLFEIYAIMKKPKTKDIQ